MSFDFLSQRLVENAKVIDFYQRCLIANTNLNSFHSQQLAYQQLILKSKATQLAQLQQLQQLNNPLSCFQTQELPNHNQFSLLSSRTPVSLSSQEAKSEPETKIEAIETINSASPVELPKRISFKNDLFSHGQPPTTGTFNLEQIPYEINKEKIESDSPSKMSFSTLNRTSKREHLDFEIFMRKELEKMIKFILSNISKSKQSEIDTMRNRYLNYPSLLQAYDTLVKKYFSSRKVKEEMIRYIIRKALKVMKTCVKDKEKVRGKKASLVLCKRYFPNHFDDLEKSNINIDNEEELVKFFMPYNKESKNRTINVNFMLELFSSDQFVRDYMKFLPNLEAELIEDNNKKLQKLVNVLMECIKCNSFDNIGSLRVFPWLDTWIEETKNIANSIVYNKGSIYNLKKVKTA